MTTVLLVRHGHVEGIRPPRFRGRAPLPLSEQGRVEAEITARRIASEWLPAAIYTSTLQRCLATAATIGLACAIEPTPIGDLDDLDYGDWQWKTFEDVEKMWPRLYALWFSAPQLVRFPNGESLQDIVLRSANALRRALEEFPDAAVVLRAIAGAPIAVRNSGRIAVPASCPKSDKNRLMARPMTLRLSQPLASVSSSLMPSIGRTRKESARRL